MRLHKFWYLLAALVLTFSLLLGGCGGEEGPKDPNLGMWNAVSASMMGFEFTAEELFPEGLTLELKENGKCVLSLEGEDYRGKWSLDGNVFTLSDSSVDVTGTLENGVLTMENLMDSGVDVVFEQEVPAAE